MNEIQGYLLTKRSRKRDEDEYNHEYCDATNLVETKTTIPSRTSNKRSELSREHKLIEPTRVDPNSNKINVYVNSKMNLSLSTEIEWIQPLQPH